MLSYFMGTKFMFIYLIFYYIFKNEEELLVDNQNEDIVSTLEQMRMSTSNTIFVDFVWSKMQGILSEVFIIDIFHATIRRSYCFRQKNQHVFTVYKIYSQSTSDAQNHC